MKIFYGTKIEILKYLDKNHVLAEVFADKGQTFTTMVKIEDIEGFEVQPEEIKK